MKKIRILLISVIATLTMLLQGCVYYQAELLEPKEQAAKLKYEREHPAPPKDLKNMKFVKVYKGPVDDGKKKAPKPYVKKWGGHGYDKDEAITKLELGKPKADHQPVVAPE